MCMGGRKSSPAPVTHNHYTEPPAEEANTEPTSDLTDPNQQQMVAAINSASSGTTNNTFGSELGG
jgi:hypothetical protein